MTDTRNPNDPRRFTRGFPDDEERRFEELFARSQKVMDTPAQLAVVESAATALTARVVVLEVSDPILKARVTALEVNNPILTARVTALESAPDVVAATYTKFKNGTLICIGQINAILSGVVFIDDIFTFPVAFIAAPTISTGTLPRVAPNANVVVVMDLTSITTTTVQARGRTWDTATSTWVLSEFRCQVTAVGRWK